VGSEHQGPAMEPSVTLDGRISGRKWDLAQENHKVLRSWAAGDVPLDFLEGYTARSEDRYDASDASLAPEPTCIPTEIASRYIHEPRPAWGQDSPIQRTLKTCSAADGKCAIRAGLTKQSAGIDSR
jgi:hypothetical protein